MRPPKASADESYLAFIREQARSLARRRPDVPATEAGWKARLGPVAEGLARSFGRTPSEPCDLAPEVLGTLVRDGYAVDRLTFQSRPGVRVTANLYRPEPSEGRRAAVLSVHGHWAWARIDPHVQARCIGLAKLGYVALAVDAFGAGERAIDPKPGTYHGALDGASLWPTGVSLLGLQVYDNRRAVDYLIGRTDVDPGRLAITGASGGGNQSLYAGATDERLAAVVPVCGVGTYESYLGTGCCVCEVNAGGLTYATTGDLLAMIAPRALLVINATKDAVQFSVAEAAKSVAVARERYRALGVDERLRHLPVDSGHDYNQTMREAMYGWLDRWLRNRGDGSPVAEPTIATEEPLALRCYPDGPSRPKAIATIPDFALAEGRDRLEALPKAPDHPEQWDAHAAHIRARLVALVDGPLAAGKSNRFLLGYERGQALSPEPGIVLGGEIDRHETRPGGRQPGRVLLIREGGSSKRDDPIATLLRKVLGRTVDVADLRATGDRKPKSDVVHGLADHNEAEWGLWIGRPLLGQWVMDALAWIDATGPREIVGVGPFGLVALIAAGLRPGKIDRVGLIGPLVSFVGKDATPWKGLPMGLIAPGLLETADVGQLAALSAPARLVIAGGVEPSGEPATPRRLAEAFAFVRTTFATLKASDRLAILPTPDVEGFARAFAAG